MAFTAREVIMTFRGQNYLSGAIRRVGADMGGLSRQAQLSNQRAQLQIVGQRLAQSKKVAQAELASVQTGVRGLSIQRARAQLTITESRQISQMTAIRTRYLTVQRQQLANEERIIELQRLESQNIKFIGMPPGVTGVTPTGKLAKSRGRIVRGALSPRQEVTTALQQAQKDQERLAETARDLQRQTESQVATISNMGLAAQQVAAREAALIQRESQLKEIINTRSKAVDANTISQYRNNFESEKIEPVQRWQQRAASIEHAGRAMQMFGLIATAAMGFAAASAAKFNSQFTLAATQARPVGAPASVTTGIAAKIQKQVLDQMRQFPASAADMSDSFYQIFSGTNIQQVSKASEAVKVFNMMAVAGSTDLKTMTDAGLTMYNNFGGLHGEFKTITQAANAFFATVRYGRMNAEQFAQALPNIAGIAHQVGLSFYDIAGAMASLTRSTGGRMTARDATGIARMIEVFAKPEFQAGAKKLGVSIKDAKGNMRPLLDIITELGKASKAHGVDAINLFKQISSLGSDTGRGGTSGTIQARRAFAFLLNNMNQYSSVSKLVRQDNNELIKSFDAMSKTPGVRWQVFINQLKVLIYQIGTQAIPAFITLGKPLVAVVGWFNKLGDGTKKNIALILTFVSVLTLLTGVLAGVGGGIARIFYARKGTNLIKKLSEDINAMSTSLAPAGDVAATRASIINPRTGLAFEQAAGTATEKLATDAGFVVTKVLAMQAAFGGLALALPILNHYHVSLLKIVSGTSGFLGLLKLLSIALTAISVIVGVRMVAAFAAARLASIAYFATASAGAEALAAALSLSIVEIGLIAVAAYGLSRAIRAIPHWDSSMRQGGATISDAINGRPGDFKTPSHTVFQNQIKEVNRLYHMYAAQGLKPIEIAVRIKAALPHVDKHDVGVFINNATQQAIAEAKAQAVSGSQRKFHDQPINFDERAIEATAKNQAGIRQQTLMQQVPGFISQINKLRAASEKYPPNVGAIVRYNQYLKQLETTLKAQPALFSAIQQAASAMYQKIGSISNATAFTEAKRIENMRKNLEKRPSLDGWIKYYTALDSLNSKMTSAQSQAIDAMIQQNDKAIKAASKNTQTSLEDVVSGTTNLFNTVLQQNQQNFGQLFSGPWISSLDKLNWGGKITSFDVTKDLNSQVSRFKTFNATIAQIAKRGAPSDLIKQLQALGPASMDQIKAIAGMSDPEINRLFSLFRTGQQLVHKQTMNDLNKQLKDYKQYGRNIALQMAAGISDTSVIQKAIKKAISDAFGSIPTQAQIDIGNTTGGNKKSPHNKADGGIIKAMPGGVFRVAEAGHPEMVIPLDPTKRSRALQLMKQTSDIVGTPSFASGGIASKRKEFYLSGRNPGLVDYGNIDLLHRKVAHLRNGNIATVKSISIGTDRGETLIPEVINGKVVSLKQAIAHYHKTGENLGTFSSIRAANRYAIRLHNQQDAFYNTPTTPLQKYGFVGAAKLQRQKDLNFAANRIVHQTYNKGFINTLRLRAQRDPLFQYELNQLVEQKTQQIQAKRDNSLAGIVGRSVLAMTPIGTAQIAGDVVRSARHGRFASAGLNAAMILPIFRAGKLVRIARDARSAVSDARTLRRGVTFYRGEGPHTTEALKNAVGGASAGWERMMYPEELRGTWFTPSKNYAKRYLHGEDARLLKVRVSKLVAKDALHGVNGGDLEALLPLEHALRARETIGSRLSRTAIGKHIPNLATIHANIRTAYLKNRFVARHNLKKLLPPDHKVTLYRGEAEGFMSLKKQGLLPDEDIVNFFTKHKEFARQHDTGGGLYKARVKQSELHDYVAPGGAGNYLLPSTIKTRRIISTDRTFAQHIPTAKKIRDEIRSIKAAQKAEPYNLFDEIGAAFSGPISAARRIGHRLRNENRGAVTVDALTGGTSHILDFMHKPMTEAEKEATKAPGIWYHGTSSVFDKFRKSKVDREALYGPGHYFTDNPKVAEGYTASGYTYAFPSVEAFKDYAKTHEVYVKNIRRMRYGVDITSPMGTLIVRSKPNKFGKKDPIFFQEGKSYISAVFENLPANIHMARLNVKHPLNLEHQVTKDTLYRLQNLLTEPSKLGGYDRPFMTSKTIMGHRFSEAEFKEIVKTVRHYESGEHWPKGVATNKHLYNQLAYYMGSKEAANRLLQKAGFDAIQHIGGGITGGVPHNVTIAFGSAQVRPHYWRGGIADQDYVGHVGEMVLTMRQQRRLADLMFGQRRGLDPNQTSTGAPQHVENHATYNITAPTSEHASIRAQLRHADFAIRNKNKPSR